MNIYYNCEHSDKMLYDLIPGTVFHFEDERTIYMVTLSFRTGEYYYLDLKTGMAYELCRRAKDYVITFPDTAIILNPKEEITYDKY